MTTSRLALGVLLIMTGCDARDTPKAKKVSETANMISKSHIPRQDLVEIFDNIRKQTNWEN